MLPCAALEHKAQPSHRHQRQRAQSSTIPLAPTPTSAKLDLKLREVPIRYRERSYGSTQISRFRHGVLLLRMVLFAYRKLKAI